MIIKSIKTLRFMGHAGGKIDLPARGVVLVTGENGSGKSTWLEAVAWALWGESLRGGKAAKLGTERVGRAPTYPEVEIGLANGTVRRCGGGRASVVLNLDGAVVTPESATHGTALVNQVVGPYDIWRRTHAFSSADASGFTQATDAQRKVFLETILGLDRFGPALEACRSDRAKAQVVLAGAQGLHRELDAVVKGHQQRLRDLTETVSQTELSVDPPPPGAVEAAAQRVNQLELAYDDEVRANAGQHARRRELRALWQAAQADLQRLDSTACHTCGRPWTGAEAEARATARMDAVARMEASEAEGRSMKLLTDQDAVPSRALLRAAQADHQALVRAQQRAEETFHWVDANRAKVRQLGLELLEAEDQLDAARAALGPAHTRTANLVVVEQVLGLRGVRANILGNALTGAQALANTWLPRLGCTGLRIELRPYTQAKSGEQRPAIGLEVHGAGGGAGYAGASGGERRRIDLALMMALSELASAGQEPGTLFFDEVFDALDGPGVTGVASMLGELAADRAVVVITHNEALVDQLQPAHHVRMDQGSPRIT